MKFLIAFSLLVLGSVLARDITLDYIHHFRFEEHNKKGHILLVAVSDVKNDKSCHVFEINDDISEQLKDQDAVEKMTEEVYALIKSHRLNETETTNKGLYQKYHDHHLFKECKGHTVYEAIYDPNFGSF